MRSRGARGLRKALLRNVVTCLDFPNIASASDATVVRMLRYAARMELEIERVAFAPILPFFPQAINAPRNAQHLGIASLRLFQRCLARHAALLWVHLDVPVALGIAPLARGTAV